MKVLCEKKLDELEEDEEETMRLCWRGDGPQAFEGDGREGERALLLLLLALRTQLPRLEVRVVETAALRIATRGGPTTTEEEEETRRDDDDEDRDHGNVADDDRNLDAIVVGGDLPFFY